MPELPEVETVRRGIEPYLCGETINGVVVRERRLRWRVTEELEQVLPGQKILAVKRRGKYLLLETLTGAVIIHLGMTGHLRIVDSPSPPGTHDHVDLLIGSCRLLRFNDPRRFGLIVWTDVDPNNHPLLAHLGVEPLEEEFDGDWLYSCSRGKRCSVKSLLMNHRILVGVGNIYANEALFRSGIHPGRRSDRISQNRYRRLAGCVKSLLAEAIESGGTTLSDFVGSDGKPGYFSQALSVYGRESKPCPRCLSPIRRRVLSQRASFFCPRCQH